MEAANVSKEEAESEYMEWESSEGTSTPNQQNRKTRKFMVFQEILQKLIDEGSVQETDTVFADELQVHFHRLPIRYALDVNPERAHDIVMHKRLLELAETHGKLPVVNVRFVHLQQVNLESGEGSPIALINSPSQGWDNSDSSDGHVKTGNISPCCASPACNNSSAKASSISPRTSVASPAWGRNSSNSSRRTGSKDSVVPMHEVTFSTVDKPKLLSKLSALLADVGLSVWEGHIFNTIDGYSLDVFLVYGWPTEDTKELEHALEDAIGNMEEGSWLKSSPPSSPSLSPASSPDSITRGKSVNGTWKGHSDTSDDWEIDFDQLKPAKKMSSTSTDDLYRGTFCGQDVTIKVVKADGTDGYQDFAHEVFIMRKVRHKNIVQFIGACTKPPNLAVITEYMPGGSVHDFLHKQKGSLKLPLLLRIALDTAKGMDYLHQNKIIHRDLKASSLLMDENMVVKVADFGVARFQAHNGLMTAETGTYRWMAPEVLGHKSYDYKADIFSFGVVLWELLTKKLPYDSLTPFQVAVGVLQEGLRPTIPEGTHPKLADLLETCWKSDPSERPNFSEITNVLRQLLNEVEGLCDSNSRRKDRQHPSFFSSLKRSSISH